MNNYEYLLDTLGKDEDIQIDLLKRLGVISDIIERMKLECQNSTEDAKKRYTKLMRQPTITEETKNEMEILARQVGFNDDLLKKLSLFDDAISGNTSHDLEKKVRKQKK